MNKKDILISVLFSALVIMAVGKIYIDSKEDKTNKIVETSNINIENNNVDVQEEINSSNDKNGITKNNNEKIDSSNNNQQENTTINKDEKIINYFNETNTYVDKNLSNNDSITSKIGDKVATMIGFIWYGEEINGITYNELTSEAKDKIKNIFYKIDSKIENKIPNYKEKIKNKYQIVSSFLKEKYTNVKATTKNYIENNVDKDKLDKIKDTYNVAKEEVKTGLQEGTNEIKEVKDIYKEKINEWYQKKKSN